MPCASLPEAYSSVVAGRCKSQATHVDTGQATAHACIRRAVGSRDSRVEITVFKRIRKLTNRLLRAKAKASRLYAAVPVYSCSNP